MIEYSLYDGKVKLVYYDDDDGRKHLYTVDGKEVPNVTKITGIIDKSYALIPWALNESEKYIHEKLDKIDGLNLTASFVSALVHDAKKAHKEKKESAGAIGTAAHDWVEEYIKNKLAFLPSPLPPPDPQVLNAVNAYLAWESVHQIHYLCNEKKVYSKWHGYAGTLDMVAIIDGILTLVDLKTSNGYREEYALQTAAYQIAYEEEFKVQIDQRIVLMMSKDDGAWFDPVVLKSEQSDKDGFLHALGLWKWKNSKRKHKKGKS